MSLSGVNTSGMIESAASENRNKYRTPPLPPVPKSRIDKEKVYIICSYVLYSVIFLVVAVVIYAIIYRWFFENSLFQAGNDLEKKDWLSFLGAYLSFVGTVAVSYIALIQGSQYNKKENDRRRLDRYESIQPLFSIEIKKNIVIPGTSHFGSLDGLSKEKRANVNYVIKHVGNYPVLHVKIFDKYQKNVLQPGENIDFTCAYYDSLEAKKWRDSIIVLSDEYSREEGNVPAWLNICYEDIDGHDMCQTFILRSFDGELYYSLMEKSMINSY